jgi:hypothetical protein
MQNWLSFQFDRFFTQAAEGTRDGTGDGAAAEGGGEAATLLTPGDDFMILHFSPKKISDIFFQESILRLLNLQLQRQHCSRLKHFSK